jgi:hypothetical protein
MLFIAHLQLVVSRVCGLVRCRGVMIDKTSCDVDNHTVVLRNFEKTTLDTRALVSVLAAGVGRVPDNV